MKILYAGWYTAQNGDLSKGNRCLTDYWILGCPMLGQPHVDQVLFAFEKLTPNGWNMRFNHQKTWPDVKGTRMEYRFPTFYRPIGSHEACETLWNCQPSQHWRLGDEWLGWESAYVTFPWCPIWLTVGGNPGMHSWPHSCSSLDGEPPKKLKQVAKTISKREQNDSNMFIHFQNGGSITLTLGRFLWKAMRKYSLFDG
jgi:hypothetical protein